MILILMSLEQEAELDAFMARQLEPRSPGLPPLAQALEFGQIYGPSDADISEVTNWLQNHGFSIDNVSKRPHLC